MRMLALPVDASPGTAPAVLSTVPGVRVLYEAPTLYRTWGKLIATPLAGGGDEVWKAGLCNRDLARNASGNIFCVASEGETSKLLRFSENLASADTIIQGLPPAFGVAVDESSVYVGAQSGLLRATSGFSGAPENLYPFAVNTQLLRVGSTLYFGSSTLRSSGSLLALNLETDEVSELLPGVTPGSIHADDSHLYFSEWGKQTLWRVDFDGKNGIMWSLGLPYADVLAGNDEFLFFTTDLDGRLFRLRK
jgi:hypothetical protein